MTLTLGIGAITVGSAVTAISVYALSLTVCVTVGMLAHHYLPDRDSPLAGGQR